MYLYFAMDAALKMSLDLLFIMFIMAQICAELSNGEQQISQNSSYSFSFYNVFYLIGEFKLLQSLCPRTGRPEKQEAKLGCEMPM